MASDRTFENVPSHPLYGTECPACGRALTGPLVLVFVGMDPDDRQETGWTTGGAVAVHPACAGVTQGEL